MSKKDRQHQHIQPIKHEPSTAGDAVRHVHQQIAQMSDAQLEAAADDVARRDDEQAITSMATESERLKAGLEKALAAETNLREQYAQLERSLEQERSRANDEYRRAEEAMLKVEDLRLVAKAARHGAPPEGFEPKTAEGKEALEQVVRLGSENATLTQRMQEDIRKLNEARDISSALRSDLMVLEQTASGRAPDIALQTDLGKSAAHALSEVLTSLDKANAAHLEGDALPANGWASAIARQLVEAVGPQPGLRASDARAVLLGDLLAQLLPHTGETGQNETASDVLKRIVFERGVLIKAQEEASRAWKAQQDRLQEQSERMVKIQSAMVARRAPDAEWLTVRDSIAGYLSGTGLGGYGIVRGVEALVNEWRGLRAFFSEAPLTAVAVRDDGAKGPVRERFSLLVLSWDGKAVSTRSVEEVRPWGDISPYLEQTVRKHLIPVAYR